MKKGIFKKSVNRLLSLVEMLTEFKTGRPAFAKYKGTLVLGIGYTKEESETGTTETYVLPFTFVQIFTPTNF